MRVLTRELLDAYLAEDPILRLIEANSEPGDDQLTTHRWLLADPAKRAVTWEVYGDLLRSDGLDVLDVGAGLSSLQRAIAARHRYTAIDVLAHDPIRTARQFVDSVPGMDLLEVDWSEATIDTDVDVIVANDLFPNVDQRLISFLRWASARCDDLILSLTYFEEPHAYAARRVDGDEVFHVASWSAAQIEACELSGGWQGLTFPDGVSPYPRSVFGNGRNVSIARLRKAVG